jgi:ABC-2 type transport system permease protein
MIKFILRGVRAFSPIWKRLGVNPEHLDAILFVKLTMDDRRPNVYNRARQKKQKSEVSNSTWVTVLMSGFMGAVLLFVFKVCTDDMSGLSLFFLMFMVMLSITLMADFSHVLIDVKDNYIILPKPVNAQTVLMARLLHILIHLSKMVIPMSLPALIYMSIHAGIVGGLLYLLDVILATLICILLINAVYLIILKFTTAERFKDIIGGVQIAFSIVLFTLYMVVPQIMGSINISESSFLDKPYLYAAPPLWLASLWEVLRHPVGQPAVLWAMAAAALVLSPLSIWIVVRYLAPNFDRKLSSLGSGTSETGTYGSGASEAGAYGSGAFAAGTPESGISAPAKGIKRKAGRGIKRKGYLAVSRWVTRGSAEATGFEIAWLLSGRNRDFKMKVYPSFAYVFVYFAYFILINNKDKLSVMERWRHLPSTHLYILLIYSSSLAMITAITNLAYSDKYKASWVYYSSPVAVPGQILTGAVKAMLVKYFVPFYMAVSALAVYIWGSGILPDLLLGIVNVTLFGAFMGFIYLKKMPFSKEFNTGEGTGRFMKGLFILLIPGIIGTGHYLIRRLLPGSQVLIWVALVLSGILVWVVYDRYRELSWAELDWS